MSSDVAVNPCLPNRRLAPWGKFQMQPGAVTALPFMHKSPCIVKLDAKC
jgi:hypothetical protein